MWFVLGLYLLLGAIIAVLFAREMRHEYRMARIQREDDQ